MKVVFIGSLIVVPVLIGSIALSWTWFSPLSSNSPNEPQQQPPQVQRPTPPSSEFAPTSTREPQALSQRLSDGPSIPGTQAAQAAEHASAEFGLTEFRNKAGDLLATAGDTHSEPPEVAKPQPEISDAAAPANHPAHGPEAHPERYNYNGTIIAVIDPDRLLKVKPTHGRSQHKGKDAQFAKEDHRLRFDSSEDWASLSDRLSIPSDGDIQISFEVEFDQQEDERMPPGDITVFWGAGGQGEDRRQGNSHSWTGYELKLGSPDREALAYKFGGHAIERDRGNHLFSAGQAHEVEITQEQGRMVLRVDGEIVMEQDDPKIRYGLQRDLKDDGRTFGLMFYHAAGYIGPITIRRPESDA